MARLIRDWRVLDSEQRLALGAAVGLFVTMLLPWYQQNGFVRTKGSEVRADSHNLSAFGAFSFVEAAILVVAIAIAYLLYARAEGREFHLPGNDGAVVFAAGLWAALLLVYRLFDKPSISHGTAANVGVQWGIFFALAAAGLLAYAGSRMRAAHHVATGHGLPSRARGRGPRAAPRSQAAGADPVERPRPEPQTALTTVAPGRGGGRAAGPGDREAGHAPPVPRDRDPRDRDTRDRESAGEPPPAPERPRYPPAPSEQMSFDDRPPDED